MIESPQGIDRGRFLYEKFPDLINHRVNDFVESYFNSQKDYLSLKRRIMSFDDLYDLRFRSNDAMISEIAVPVSRKIMLESKAYIRKYFENDPLFTLFSRFETPTENAEIAQQVLNYNLSMTNYRRDCMFWQIDCAAKYGVYVTFSQYVEGFNQKGNITRYNPKSIGTYETIKAEPTRKNMVSYPIHPLNYMQDISASFSYEPQWKGFIDRWSIPQLFQLIDDDRYIQPVLKEIAEKAKKGIRDQYYWGADANFNNERIDLSKHTVHIRRLWLKLPIEGNEDDDSTYYAESIDNKIIRIEENKYDKDMCPLVVGNVMPRINTWWGNAGHESKIAHQNLMNWIINSQVESTMKSMDRLILVRKGGGIDWSAVNNRHRTGGVVPVETMEPLQNLIYNAQFNNPSMNSVDWLLKELKEQIQSENPITNLQSQYNQSGLNNSTLGAAQMIASIGEILQSDTMNNFSFGQKEIAESQLIGLQQLLEDQFYIKRKPDANPELVDRFKILGDFDFNIETSLKLNDQINFTQRANLLTQLFNWAVPAQANGFPLAQMVNWEQLVREIIKYGIGSNTDIDKYVNQMQQQGPQGPMQQPPNPASGLPGTPGLPPPGAPAPQTAPQAPQGMQIAK